jgi:hypothetical protein
MTLRNAEATRGLPLCRVPTPDRCIDDGHDVGAHRHGGGIFGTIFQRVPHIGEGLSFHCCFPRLLARFLGKFAQAIERIP